MKVIEKFKFTLFTIIFSSLIMVSCSKDDLCVRADGNVISKEIIISNFDGIKTYGNDHIIITQGEVQKVEVTGHSNIIARLETDVKNGIWEIELENGCYSGNTALTINIVLPKINLIGLEGSGSVVVDDFTDQEDLVLDLIGSGDIELNRNEGTEKMFIDIEGSGTVSILNDFLDLKYLEINIFGSGNYNGFPNITDECYINNEGSGDCNINVRNILEVNIVGSGNVNYKGNPEIDATITGSGRVNNMN